MDISEFKLQKIILELRYDPAYLIWDNIGAMWHAASKEWRGLEMSSADPNATVFKWKNLYELGVYTERARVMAQHPGAALDEEVYQVFDKFVEMVVSALEIDEFSRIGLRSIFYKDCGSEDEAINQMLSLGLLNPPKGMHFGVDGNFTNLSYDARWVGDEIGAKVLVATQSEEISFDPPPGLDELPSLHKKRDLLFYDVDYFTTGSTAVGLFSPLEWVPHVMQVIRRDAGDFLGG